MGATQSVMFRGSTFAPSTRKRFASRRTGERSSVTKKLPMHSLMSTSAFSGSVTSRASACMNSMQSPRLLSRARRLATPMIGAGSMA
jgi:hypothetical protein